MKVLVVLAVLAIANSLQQGYCNSSEEENDNSSKRTEKFQTQGQLGRTVTENEAFDFQQFESQLKDMASENAVFEFHHLEPGVGPQTGGIIKRTNAKKKRANVAFALKHDKYEYYPTSQYCCQEEEQDDCDADCSEAMHFGNYSDDFGTEFSLQPETNATGLGVGSGNDKLNMENVLTDLFSNIHFVPSSQEQAHFNVPSENIPRRADKSSYLNYTEDDLQESSKLMDRSSSDHNDEDQCLLGNIFKNLEYEDSFSRGNWNERSTDDNFIPDTSTPNQSLVGIPFDDVSLFDTKKRWDIFQMQSSDGCCKLKNTESEQRPIGINSKCTNPEHSVEKLCLSTQDNSNPSSSAVAASDSAAPISSDDLISFPTLSSNINNEIENENCNSTKKLNIIDIEINAQLITASAPKDNSLHPKSNQDEERLSDGDSMWSTAQKKEKDKKSSLICTDNSCSTSTSQNVPCTLNETQPTAAPPSDSQMWQWEIYDSSDSIASDEESVLIQSDPNTQPININPHASSIDDETKSITESVATEQLIPEPAFDRLRKFHNLDENAEVTHRHTATVGDESISATNSRSSTPLALPIIKDCSNDGIECECNTKKTTSASTLDSSIQNDDNDADEEGGATWFGLLVGMIRRIFGNLFQ